MEFRTIELGDTAAPVELDVLQNGTGVTGLIPTFAVRRLSDNFFLDFADNAFKSSGWTTKNQALSEITGIAEVAGKYRTLWNSSLSITAQGLYSLEFTTDDIGDHDTEYVVFLKRELAIKSLVNRLVINEASSLLEIYDDDGTTLLETWPLTDKNGNSIVLEGTGPANRGAPS